MSANIISFIFSLTLRGRLGWGILCLISLHSLSAIASEPDTTVTEAAKFKLFSPLTYSHNAIGRLFNFDAKTDSTAINADDAADRALLNIYLKRPDLIQTTQAELEDATDININIDKPIDHKPVIVEEKIDIIDDVIVTDPTTLVIEKPNFWTIKGDYNLQFLQNYISGNWYKGGESSYSFVASGTLEANYNNKQKVTWDNKLEARIGFQTTKGDTLHQFKTSEDLLRYTGKLGIQASKRWYYTMQLLSYTQFTTGYKSNNPKVFSDFCSPLNVNLSLGMQYKPEWFKKKLTGSVLISPLAYNFRYVGRLALSTNYGLKKDRHTMDDFGSSLTADLTWKFADNIKWKTRLYAFTSYHRVEAEWENTFSFSFNKYISTNIFVYPRFDDGAKKRDKDYGYFQLKEYASLGFNYSF